MRLFVHEPMNTVSTATSRILVPASRPMYSSARVTDSCVVGLSKSVGAGMTASIDATCPGLVPHETCGVIDAASSTTSLSQTASSSERSVRQSATAASQSAPDGACSRPCR